MKKLLYLGIVFLLGSCGANESESSVVPNELVNTVSNESESVALILNKGGRDVSTIKMGDLEVMNEDLDQMNCEDLEGLQIADFNDVPDKYSGIAFECYNGKVKAMGNVKDGKWTGLVRSWWDNGQLEGEAYFKDGKPQGTVRSWSPNGTRDAEINVKDGKMDGLSIAWDDNDILMEKRNYKKGKQDGLQRSWYNNGVLRKESNFKDGELLNSKCWDEQGNEVECQ